MKTTATILIVIFLFVGQCLCAQEPDLSGHASYFLNLLEIEFQLDSNSVSEARMYLAEQQKEIDYFFLDLIEKNISYFDGDSILMVSSLREAALLSDKIGDKEKSLSYNEKFIKKIEEIENNDISYSGNLSEDKIEVCFELAHLFFDKKEYDKALEYIFLIQKDIPKITSFYQKKSLQRKIDFLYARVLDAKKKYSEAVELIIPYVFSEGFYNDTIKEQERIDFTVALLLEVYDSEYLMQEMNKSFEDIFLKQTNPYFTKKHYYTRFLGRECEIKYIEWNGSTGDDKVDNNYNSMSREDVENIIREYSYFYSILSR